MGVAEPLPELEHGPGLGLVPDLLDREKAAVSSQPLQHDPLSATSQGPVREPDLERLGLGLQFLAEGEGRLLGPSRHGQTLVGLLPGMAHIENGV